MADYGMCHIYGLLSGTGLADMQLQLYHSQRYLRLIG